MSASSPSDDSPRAGVCHGSERSAPARRRPATPNRPGAFAGRRPVQPGEGGKLVPVSHPSARPVGSARPAGSAALAQRRGPGAAAVGDAAAPRPGRRSPRRGRTGPRRSSGRVIPGPITVIVAADHSAHPGLARRRNPGVLRLAASEAGGSCGRRPRRAGRRPRHSGQRVNKRPYAPAARRARSVGGASRGWSRVGARSRVRTPTTCWRWNPHHP